MMAASANRLEKRETFFYCHIGQKMLMVVINFLNVFIAVLSPLCQFQNNAWISEFISVKQFFCTETDEYKQFGESYLKILCHIYAKTDLQRIKMFILFFNRYTQHHSE
jgi:hypothetical protein